MALNPRTLDWTGRTVWLVGASTGIGRATASALHAAGARVVVSARSREGLDAFVVAHPAAWPWRWTPPTAARCTPPPRRSWPATAASTWRCTAPAPTPPCAPPPVDLDVALRHVRVNYDGALFMLDAVLPTLLAQAKTGRGGHISLVSSVAGFRGLPQSLAYGPTKAALINLAETLYLDLAPLKVGVSVINPGFVETPLTAQNAFKMPALITPEQAATHILAGWRAGDFEIHFPKRFTRWLKAMRHLPYSLYFAAVSRSTGL